MELEHVQQQQEVVHPQVVIVVVVELLLDLAEDLDDFDVSWEVHVFVEEGWYYFGMGLLIQRQY